MHSHSLHRWQHSHSFLGASHHRHERRTWIVVAVTAAMMVAEIIGGTLFGSMAVVADGWHMATHAGALAIAGFAYRFARTHVDDPRFSFGTGKVGELAAFTSAVTLALIALAIGYEAVTRLSAPVAIDFDEAIVLAVIGLMVNIGCAGLLHDSGHGHHDHAHNDDHHEPHPAHHDSNHRAAYVHVLADAVTSVLAIAGLVLGRFYGWVFMDPLMALVGVAVILSWSVGLLRTAGAVLLDMIPDRKLAAMLRSRLEIDGDKVCDLHLWRLGPGHAGVIASVVSDNPQAPAVYKERLAGIDGLSHVTVEVLPCDHRAAA